MKADLGGLSGGKRGENSMSSKKKVFMNKKSGAGGIDSSDEGSFAGKNGGFGFFRFANAVAET